MSQPLRPNQVKIHVLRQYVPWLSADGQWLHVSAILVNRGNETLSSEGEFPVVVVARLVDANGNNVDDRLALGPLPNPLPPDNTEAIEIKVPTARLAGHSVELLPVQMGVSGFDKWGTEVLRLGPFANCDLPGPRDHTLCGGPGDPLVHATDIPSVARTP